MHQRQLAVGGGRGHLHVHLGHFERQAIPQPTVLGHGKTVARWQGQNKLIRVKSAHEAVDFGGI